MIEWYKNLDVYIKSLIITALISLVAFLGCIPLYFANFGEIPNGIALSGTISSLLFLIYEIGKNSPRLGKSIFANILRFMLVIVLFFVTTLLYYRFEIKIFNVFAVVLTFFMSTIVFVTISFLENRNEATSL